MAKEAVINVKVNQGNALSNMKKELKEIKAELLGLDRGSARFKELTLRAGELHDTMGDLSARVKAFSSDTKKLDALVGVGRGIANSFQIATGAAALFGGEAKELQAAMQKIVIVQGMLNAVTELSNYLKGEGLVQDRIKAIQSKIQLAITNAQTIAEQKLTGAVVQQTVTQRVLAAVMKTNPVFLLIGAFTALVGVFLLMENAADDAAKAQEAVNEAQKEGLKSAIQEENQIKLLVYTITDYNSSVYNKKKAIEELNKISPEYLGNITLENIGTAESIDLISDYIKSIQLQTEVKVLQNKLMDATIIRMDEEAELNKRLAKYGWDVNQSKEELARLTADERRQRDDLINGFNEELNAAKFIEGSIMQEIKNRQDLINVIVNEREIRKGVAKGVDEDRKVEKKVIEEKYKFEISAADQARLDLAKIEILKAKTVEERAIAETNYLKLQHEIQIKDKSLTISKILLMEAELASEIKKINDDVTEYHKQQNIKRLESTEVKTIETNNKVKDDTKSMYDTMAELGVQAQKEEKERLDKQKQDRIDNINKVIEYADAAMDILSNINDFNDQKDEQRAQARQASYDAEIETYANMLGNKEITQREYDEKVELNRKKAAEAERAAKLKAFQRDKKFSLMQAIINTAESVAKSVALSPASFGLPWSAINAAIGGVQIATISSSKFQANRGGVVPNNGQPSHIDSVPALLAPGEMVINSRSSSMFGGLLSQLNMAGGGISLAPEVPMQTSIESVYNENRQQTTVKAYVVATEMNDTNRRMSRLERRATFG